MPEVQADPISLPPWVHFSPDVHERPTALQLPPTAPTRPSAPRHHPPQKHFRHGQKWDAYRSAEPPLLSAPVAEEQARWIPFMQSGPNPSSFRGDSRIVSEQWMEEHMPVVMRGWQPGDEHDPKAVHNKSSASLRWLISPERQEKTVMVFWRLLLKNAFVPLVFRITSLAFSAAALGLAATLYVTVKEYNQSMGFSQENRCQTRASTYMAIVVGAFAIPYVAYVTWDEYMAKPLGLRSVLAKTLLLLCDLYFIVFSASNVTLALEALRDTSWACYGRQTQHVAGVDYIERQTCPHNNDICYKQGALSGILVVTLMSWLLCFSISVMRVVEKLRVE